MPFPRRLLNEGEEVVLDLRPHWWFLAGPFAVTAVSAVAVLALRGTSWPLRVALACLVVTGLWLVGRWLRWMTTNFVVTTDRLVARSGVLAKQGREIPLERVNDIAFNQSVFERLIGSGDLVIESGGERGQQHFTDISKPSRVQNEIYRQIELAGDRERQAGRSLSMPEQLEKLDELRQRGVLTQAEFDKKKAELLGGP